MRTLFLIPSLNYGGEAKQLSILATNLPREQFQVRVCVLGDLGPLGRALQAASIEVTSLNWTRAFDARPLLRLRQTIAEFQPDVIEAWGLATLRATRSVATRRRVLFRGSPGRKHDAPSLFDRWLLRKVDAITVAQRCTAQAYEPLRLSAGVRYVGQGVAAGARKAPRHELLQSVKLPQNARFITCVGPLTARKGFRDAIWALDILKCVHDDLFLVLVGDGPERQNLEEFARAIRVIDRVRFAGVQPDIAPWLHSADIVWVPSVTAGGSNVALEAMSAARPIVASRLPELAEIVVDGETGRLFNPGDKVGLARQTHALLQNDELRKQLGDAGQERALKSFAVADMTRRYAEVLQRLAA